MLEILGNLAGGFATAAQPFNLLMLLIGVLLGLVIGVLPGLGGTSGVAILLPVTVYIAASGPGLALASSFLASFVGAFFATVLFTFFSSLLADFALRFGPAELFAVFVLSFATLVGLGAEAPMKSVAMIGLGLLLAAVGFDTLTGEPRLTFGRTEVLAGIGFVPVTIGLFGLRAILASAEG